MTAEIICVGNELLYGDALNTNTQYLSQQMAELGIDVRYQMVVGDVEEDLISAIKMASDRVDVVLFTGGLGPTYDDMTKETVAKALGEEMVLDEIALSQVKGYFDRAGREMKDSNIKQAYRPEGGICLKNDNGTAPGVYIEKNDTHYFLLPGPPIEMKPMFEKSVKPVLVAKADYVIASKLFGLAGIGESSLVGEIGHIMDDSVNPRVAPYAKTGVVNIRVTAKGRTEEEAYAMVEGTTAELMPHIRHYMYTDCGESIEEVIVREMKERRLSLSTAESCTGGLVSSRVVDVPGASGVLLEGFVTYSNEAKMRRLNVPGEMLDSYGAVSEEVARAMAAGVKAVSGTDYGIGITGIAGPDGGTEEKPVGTVYIGVAGPVSTQVYKHYFSGNRRKVRELSAQYALNHLYEHLRERG